MKSIKLRLSRFMLRQSYDMISQKFDSNKKRQLNEYFFEVKV